MKKLLFPIVAADFWWFIAFSGTQYVIGFFRFPAWQCALISMWVLGVGVVAKGIRFQESTEKA